MAIKYPYLPEGREIKYVPADNVFMKEAERTCRALSTDHSFPTGAVIVKNGQIVARSGNKSKISNPKLIKMHKDGMCVRRILKVPTGQKYWLCPGCASPKDHSEQRAVSEAQRKNIDISGADLFLYGHWWCCKPCWDKMIAAGVKDVYLMEGSDQLFNKR